MDQILGSRSLGVALFPSNCFVDATLMSANGTASLAPDQRSVVRFRPGEVDPHRGGLEAPL